MSAARRPSRRNPAVLKYRDHGRLWRLVEGGVVDAFRSHPDYLTTRGQRFAVQSITKRVVGQIVGHIKQAQGAVGSGASGANSRGGAECYGAHQGAERCLTLLRTRSFSVTVKIGRTGCENGTL